MTILTPNGIASTPDEKTALEIAAQAMLADTSGQHVFESVLTAIQVERADNREKLAQWISKHGFATGHGDTMEDLLRELTWQVEELRTKAAVDEIERLRSALERIHLSADDPWTVAREALEKTV